MNDEDEAMVENALACGRAADVVRLRCPACGGKMRVVYASKPKAYLGSECLSCCWRLHLDGVLEKPPWVSVLGDSFECE